MKRIRIVLCTLVVLIAFIGASMWTLYQQVRQEKLDRGLIAAIEQRATDRAIIMLVQGADANARELPTVHRSFWRVLWEKLSRKTSPRAARAPTAIALVMKQANREFLSLVDPAPEESQSPQPWTVASKSVETRYLPLVNALLDRGADTNVAIDGLPYKTHATPLILATANNWTQIQPLLLQHGADVNARESGGTTALMRAVLSYYYCHSTKSVEFLIQHGADVNARNDHGWSALKYAQSDAPIISILKKAGATE